MYRLNVKLLVILAVTVLVLMTGVVVVHGIQMNRNIESLIKRAETARTNDDPQSAFKLYERYLAYRPDDLERRAEFATFLADQALAGGGSGFYFSGRRELQQALVGLEGGEGSKEKVSELRRKLIDLNIYFREFKTAEEDLLKLKAKGEGDAKADLQLAHCYIQTVHYLKAVTLLQSLIGYDSESRSFDVKKATTPHELDAYSLLASLLREKVPDRDIPGRVELADKVINQLVSVNSESAKAFLIQAQYLSEYKTRDAAKPAVDKALALDPKNADVLLAAADVAMRSQDYSGAEKWVTEGIKLYPKDERFYRFSVVLSELQKDSAEATQRLAQGMEALPTNVPLLMMHFDRQLQQRNFDGARTTIKKLASARFRSEMLEFYECRLLMAEGQFSEASRRLEQLRPQWGKFQQSTRQLDSLLAQCYMSLNQPDRTLEVSERVKDTPEGQLGMAYALAAIGRTQEALKIYTNIANLLEQGDQVKKVPQLATAILQLQISLQMSKPKPDRDWTAVDNLIAKMRKENYLQEPAASLVEVTVLTCKGEAEKARQMVAELVKSYPKDLAVVSRAVTLALQNRQAEEAVRLIDAAPEEIRNDPALVAGRIEAQLVAGGTRDEIKPALTAMARDANKLPPDRHSFRIYASLGMAHLRLGDTQSAREYWSQSAQWQPHNPSIRLLMFNCARTGDLASMKEILAWFEKENANDQAQCKLMQAAVLISTVQQAQRAKQSAGQPQQISLDESERQNLRTARKLLREVEDLRKGWVEQPKLMAEISMLEGLPDDAIQRLRAAFSLGQPTAEIVKQLAILLNMRHRVEEAGDLLENYAVLVAGDAAMEQLRAEIYMKRGQNDKALELMKKNYSKDSVNPREHLVYGEILAAAGQAKEAEEEFRKAVELAPEMSEGWLDLVRLFMVNRQPERALEAVLDAQIKLPEDRRALPLAQGYEMLRDHGQAEKYYLSALSVAPKNLLLLQQVAAYYIRSGRTEQAKKYLNEIMRSEPTQPVDKECYAWARRVTAQLLAAGGTWGQFELSMELLSQAATDDDLVTRKALLFERSEPSSTRKALRLIEDLKKLRPLSWSERLMLAQLHERLGNWTQAREEMLSLLTLPKPDSKIYSTYVEMLLRRGSAADAQTWWLKLQSAVGEKTPPEVTLLAARILAMQGKGPQATKLLLDLLPAERPLPQDKWPLLRQVAFYLEQIGQLDPAEKLLRELVGYENQQVALLAEFLARQGKIDATLDLAEKNRKHLSVLQVLHVGSLALRRSTAAPKPEQIQRVEQWFDRAQTEDPDSLDLKLELCDFREFQRKFDDVEKLYREILRRPDLPSKVRAGIMNNIAFLLALSGRDSDEALRLINEAISLYGPDSDMLDTRGLVYLVKRDPQRALDDLSDAVIVTGPKPIKYVHLAMAQEATNDYPAARKSLDTAKALKFNALDLSPLEKSQCEALFKRLGVSL